MVVGTLATTLRVWNGALAHEPLHRLAVVASVTSAVLAVLQLGVLVDDIDAPSLLGSIWRIRLFDLGVGLLIRILLAIAMVVTLTILRRHRSHLGLGACTVFAVALLATWSYVGHSKSQRWSLVGLPLDVIHHGAAAAWIGALAIVGFVAPTVLDQTALHQVVRRLSPFAFGAVATLTITGVVQSVRLAGISNSFDSDHTKILAAKIVAVAVMLSLADQNRRRISAGLEAGVTKLRRMIVAEFIVGMFVIALTSSLVVASPASANSSLPIMPSSTNTSSYN